MQLPTYQLYVGGDWRGAEGGGVFTSVNPYTGEAWAIAADATVVDVDAAVAAARAALHGPWAAMTGFERADLMRRLADAIGRDADEIARIETRDNGKLLREMRGQVDALPAWLRYFAGAADKLHGETIPSDRPNFLTYTRHEPVGVVAAVVPWNSPLLLTMWKLAPALAAGCAVIVKPSELTPISALELARRVDEAGFPPGVVNVLTGDGPALSRALVAHPGVEMIAFTGSTAVGKAIAETAAGRLVRTTLELGGKSAQVVFEDCDLAAAVNGIVAGIFAAAGQTCIAGSRLIVQTSIRDELVERLAARAETIVLGDPLEPATEMGPLASHRQLETVAGFVDRAVAAGATIVTGGAHTAHEGFFFPPTILADVDPAMEIAQDEVFGPVLAVIAFDDEDEAIRLANDSRYGLAAGVWTQNVQRAHRVAAALRAGTVWVNAYRVVAPNVPFGGARLSGWGRENGLEAVRSFTETKAVWVETSGTTRDPFVLG